MSGSAGQAITAVAQAYCIVYVDRLRDCYQLFRRMATSVAAPIDPMTAAAATMIKRHARLVFGCRITCFRYQFLAIVVTRWSPAMTFATTGLLVRLRAGPHFWWLLQADGNHLSKVLRPQPVIKASFISPRINSSMALSTSSPAGSTIWTRSLCLTIVSSQSCPLQLWSVWRCLFQPWIPSRPYWIIHPREALFKYIELSRFKILIKVEITRSSSILKCVNDSLSNLQL